MSIVGPRPHAVAHNEQYRKLIKGYMLRHKAKPGITGWAQVNGLRGETETLDKMEARIRYDLDYWSVCSISGTGQSRVAAAKCALKAAPEKDRKNKLFPKLNFSPLQCVHEVANLSRFPARARLKLCCRFYLDLIIL
jgi:hypothetical protein